MSFNRLEAQEPWMGRPLILIGRAATQACVALVFFGFTSLIAQSVRPLTEAQVEQLISVAPDKALAREIRQRGIKFKVDQSGLARFTNLGAGPSTLLSLRELLANAQLRVISTPPNCDVFLNGREVGKTDDTGKLLISELDAGKLEVRLLKSGYKEQTLDATLKQNLTAELHVTLELSPGLLSVLTNPPNSSILVTRTDVDPDVNSGEPCRVLSSSLWECPPAEYVITATQQGFRSASQTARVVNGKSITVSLVLLPDPPSSAVVDGSTGEHINPYDPRSTLTRKNQDAPTNSKRPDVGIPTRMWRDPSDNKQLKIHFDNGQVLIYDRKDVRVAELSLHRDKNGRKPDKYIGKYSMKGPGLCRNGGQIEITEWSSTRIEGRYERPDPRRGDDICTKLFIIAGPPDDFWNRFILVPY